MIEEEILDALDNCNDGHYCSFVDLGDPYSYLIDTRLNVFSAYDNRWAIAIERLGYSPRAGTIALEIYYYGNCLINLEHYNNYPTNSYSIYPVETDSFDDAIEDESLKPEAKFWVIRAQQLVLSHKKQHYEDAGIELKQHKPNEIRVEEATRLLVLNNRELFRATDSELYKSIPRDVKKILVLDEWFHKDFRLQNTPTLTDEDLREAYELNKNLPGFSEFTFENLKQSFGQHQISAANQHRKTWEDNRPSSYETWQQITKVIVTGDTSHYKPTLKPNTHWTNWPESGSL